MSEWYFDGRYMVRMVGDYKEYLHRHIMGLKRGDPRKVDHINGDKLDNHPENLRICTNAENLQNRRPRSKPRGVTWDKERGKWKAQVMVNGKNHQVGRYDTEDEAARAAADFRREHMPFAEEARL